jgi:branched-chain amino acid aminotransferase
VISLLRDAGTVVREDTLTHADFIAADEIFATGNYTKVMPITRIEGRELQPGPVYRRALRLYWEYSHST